MSMPWYGTLPERWEAKKVTELFVERRTKVSDKDYAPLSVSKGGIVPQIATVAKSNAGDNRKLVRQGDFVINSRSDRRGSSGVSAYDGSVSLINIVLEPRVEENPHYYHYLLRSHKFIEEYYRNGRGIVADLWTTRYTEMKAVSLPLPPRDEQDQIVRYLDWKVSQINKLINAKRRQIALLQEKIDVLTNNAILSSKSKVRLKFIVDVLRDWIEREKGVFYTPAGVLNRGRGVFHKTPLLGEDLGSSDFFSLEANALMISGQFAWEGAVALTTEKEIGCVASHRYYTLRGKNNICDTAFLWAFFQTNTGDIILNQCSHGAAGRNKPLNFNELLNKYIPLPSVELQNEITLHVSIYKQLREKVKQLGYLVHEYRTRLISDVVTGKLDVRGVVVPEYEAVEDVAEDGYAEDEREEMEDAE